MMILSYLLMMYSWSILIFVALVDRFQGATKSTEDTREYFGAIGITYEED